jgi:hypothetical protein
MSGIGGKSQQKDQNKIFGQSAAMMQPGNVYKNAGILNPWLMGALSGNEAMYGGSGYGQNLFNIANNPGYIDPSLQNQPFHLSAQRQGQDLNRAQAILGKTQGGTSASGLGNAFVHANQAARTARDVNTNQQYTLFREQQRRADLQMLQQQLMATLGQASGNARYQGQFNAMQQAPQNAWQLGGDALSRGLAGAGGKASPQSGGGGNAAVAGMNAYTGTPGMGMMANTPWQFPGGGMF